MQQVVIDRDDPTTYTPVLFKEENSWKIEIVTVKSAEPEIVLAAFVDSRQYGSKIFVLPQEKEKTTRERIDDLFALVERIQMDTAEGELQQFRAEKRKLS